MLLHKILVCQTREKTGIERKEKEGEKERKRENAKKAIGFKYRTNFMSFLFWHEIGCQKLFHDPFLLVTSRLTFQFVSFAKKQTRIFSL